MEEFISFVMNSENSRNPNHLAGETSPYLKQHMYNPVDWYPWGEDAFKKALKEEKPIFLSIGYSTCHWCHVMAHESFEDEQIAKYLNEHFVSIKLDREERPDIDQIYQNIIQMMGKRGGWPLSIFMTSDQKPFFAGTYFPKEKKYGMETFLNILKQIVDLNQKRRYDLVHTGNQVLDTLEKLSSRTLDKSEDLSKDILQLAMVTLEPSFNSKYGGFGNAPKFPNFPALLFILRQISEETLDHPGKYSTIKHELENTLDKISAGGIFDHVGGGFARYSIDEQWMIPHFEKMLYDNAMALQVYSEAYYLFQKPRYKEVVRDTINWVFREMLAENIGFFSAIDADSEGEEGKYYVWSKEDLESIIPKENREKFFQAYGITESGNFERNTNHLYVADTKLIKENKDKFKPILKLLLTKRMQRTPPNVDNKILTSWSSMMVLGLFSAYKILNDKLILNIAHNVLQSIGTNLFSEEESILYRVLDPNTKRRTIIGHLDDYAYFIQALYQDFQYFPDISSINLIGKLIEVTIDQFWDASNEVFYYSSSKNLDLPTRLQSGSDMPLPNPNAVMAENLIRLHYYLGDPHNLIYLKKAESILSSFIESSYSQPIAYGAMLIAMQWYFYGSVDIMINDDFMPKDEILQQIHQFYIPRLHFWNKKSVPLELSSFASKFEFDSKYTFYLCLHFNCLPPTNNWNVFISQLKNNVFSI